MSSTMTPSPPTRSNLRVRPESPLPQRWTRVDGEEDIARVRLGAGSPFDAAIGQRLSALRSALHGSLVVVLERRTGENPPPADPVLQVGDALYLVGPPQHVRAIIGL